MDKDLRSNKTFFEKNAKNMIDFVLDPSGHELVFNGLSRSESSMAKTGMTGFLKDFVPAKLALGCGLWSQCCDAHGVEDSDIKNLFFREVMSRFESPNSLEIATRFSEALYAANANPEDSPVLTITTHLFDKLGLKRISGELATSGISESFLFAMEVFEALKNAFEYEFDGLIGADDFRNNQ